MDWTEVVLALVALQATTLLLLQRVAAGDFLALLLAPIMSATCDHVECERRTCKAPLDYTVGFICECNQGWSQFHVGDSFRLSPRSSYSDGGLCSRPHGRMLPGSSQASTPSRLLVPDFVSTSSDTTPGLLSALCSRRLMALGSAPATSFNHSRVQPEVPETRQRLPTPSYPLPTPAFISEQPRCLCLRSMALLSADSTVPAASADGSCRLQPDAHPAPCADATCPRIHVSLGLGSRLPTPESATDAHPSPYADATCPDSQLPMPASAPDTTPPVSHLSLTSSAMHAQEIASSAWSHACAQGVLPFLRIKP